MMPERQPCCSSVEPVLKNPVKQRLYRVYAKQKNREPAACLQNRVPRVRILLPLPKRDTAIGVSFFVSLQIEPEGTRVPCGSAKAPPAADEARLGWRSDRNGAP